jgi:hypothetical protein
VTGYDGLQFTICLWGLEKENGILSQTVTIEKEDFLPFLLDMKLYWNAEDELAFDVFHKPGQQIKYLNSDCTHPPHVFRAIKYGVLKCLASLMTCDEESAHQTMLLLHSDHHEAMQDARLSKLSEASDTLSQVLERTKILESKKEEKKKCDDDRNRKVYFCIGYLTLWRHPLHKIILTNLKKRHRLSWLRFSMYYHRFPNLRDVFQSHLSAKMLENVVSEDLVTRPCNCSNRTRLATDGMSLRGDLP